MRTKLAALSLAAAAGLARLEALLVGVFHAHAPLRDELFSATLSTSWPAAEYFLSALTRTLVFGGLIALGVRILRDGWKQRVWWLWVGGALVLVALGPGHAHSLATFGVGWVMSFIPFLAAALVAGFFLRNNILAYVLVLFCTQVAEPLLTLLAQPNDFFLKNGVALALASAVLLAWLLWPGGGVEEPQ